MPQARCQSCPSLTKAKSGLYEQFEYLLCKITKPNSHVISFFGSEISPYFTTGTYVLPNEVVVFADKFRCTKILTILSLFKKENSVFN